MTASTNTVMSVGALTQLLKHALETSFSAIAVEGEVSGAKLSTSGHLYFSLKDRDAVIQAVMFKFRHDTLDFTVKDGQKVVVRGALSVYAPRGQYQIIVNSLRRSGVGDLLAMIEERKRRFAEEGLFDNERKRRLPRLPTCVGVVTSPTGAALRDILSILGRRNSGIDVLILPTLVQGDDAGRQIAARIAQANSIGGIDALIVGRGGGAPEDLAAFSEEAVVRAIHESGIPVISAVGHETDWALSDFVADLRAPTPSAAAELVAETRAALVQEIIQHRKTLTASMNALIEYAKSSMATFSRRDVEAHFMRRFLPLARKYDDARDALASGIRGALRESSHRLRLSTAGIEGASPRTILARGYSIVRERSDGSDKHSNLGLGTGRIIKHASGLVSGSSLDIYFSSGHATVDVVEVDH